MTTPSERRIPRRIPRLGRLLGSPQCIRIALALGGGGLFRLFRRLNASTLLGVLTLSSSSTLGLQLNTVRKRDSLLRIDARALSCLRVGDADSLRQVARAL